MTDNSYEYGYEQGYLEGERKGSMKCIEILQEILQEITLKEQTFTDKYGQQMYGVRSTDIASIIDKYMEMDSWELVSK